MSPRQCVLLSGPHDLERRLLAPEQLDAIGRIARSAQSHRVRIELVEPFHQLVVGNDAVVARLAGRLQIRDPIVDVHLGDRGRWRDPVEEVPVVGERLGHRAQVRELDADREPEHDHLLDTARSSTI